MRLTKSQFNDQKLTDRLGVHYANRTALLGVSSLAIATLLTPSLAGALNIGDIELSIRPRVEGGLMYYEFEQDASVDINDSESASLTLVQDKLKFKDTLPVVLGGVTFYSHRFFVDISVQKAFDGSDRDSGSSSISVIDFGGVANTELRATEFDADFDRTEYAVSVGYAINERIAVFAGYKRAKTEFDNVRGTGRFNSRVVIGEAVSTNSGNVKTDEDLDFEYDGPFVGLTYGLDVSKAFLKGVVSFNFAAAFLNSDVERKSQGELIFDDGFVRSIPKEVSHSKGDTLGVTFGLGWQGLIKRGLIRQDDNLGYSINVNAYQFNFDADDSDNPDIKETAINFRVGLAYAF